MGSGACSLGKILKIDVLNHLGSKFAIGGIFASIAMCMESQMYVAKLTVIQVDTKTFYEISAKQYH